MGSSAIMDDSTRYRGRTTLVQVPSGGDDDNDNHRKRQSTKVRRRRRRPPEEPFGILFIKVGATLLAFCLTLFWCYRRMVPYDPEYGVVEEIVYVVDDTIPNDDHAAGAVVVEQKELPPENSSLILQPHASSSEEKDSSSSNSQDYTAKDEAQLALLMKQQKKAAEEAAAKAEEAKLAETAPPLPTFDLSDASEWDAYGILKHTDGSSLPAVAAAGNTTTLDSVQATDSNTTTSFWQVAQELRKRFAETYGTENIARMLLDKGMTTFGAPPDADQPPGDVVSTACRLAQAKREQRPFRVAFGGYSVTAGRGNRFEQSFPFQMQRLLTDVFTKAGIPDLQVTNAAIGGCPAFPYGWCMKNFWGDAPDVVSWDYSMNEAGGVPQGLEAYVRHLVATFPVVPKLIVKDTYLAGQRRDVLGAYATLLKDPVVIHTGPAVKPFLERKEEHNPIGFQEWRKFGAPIGAPGQALHHPALKEHEMIGWMLAMHFLTALEYLESESSTGEDNLQCSDMESASPSVLPRPMTGSNTTVYDGILFGRAFSNNTNAKEEWFVNPIHCRTTFQPIVSGDLSEIVVSGTIAEDLDVTLPKSQMYYNQGWTFDLSEEEKLTKRQLSLYPNGLGFVDSKEAYYGIYESPVMQLLLPYKSNSNSNNSPRVGQPAKDWFESIVICQVNEKREPDACNMESDIGFTVGGANVTTPHMMKDMGTLYLGKPVCAKLDIPWNATLTSHNQLVAAASSKLEVDQVGVLVEINVTNPHIAHIHQACSVSHVVWEQKQMPVSLPSNQHQHDTATAA